MEEFNLDNNFEIGTSISKLKNSNKKQTDYNDLLILIKNLSDRLDDIENNNIDSIQMIDKPIKKEKEKKKRTDLNHTSNNIKKEEKKCNFIELFVYIIIFILLNDQFTVKTIYNIPFFKNVNNPYPNLILRTILFGLLIYLYKKYLNKN
jgi:purine-cytosine permease-like protein